MGCSVMIIARNEAENIVDCMMSCAAFATDFVIVDDFSTDDMVERIQASPVGHIARVFRHALDGDWGQQQTYGIEQCREEWVFLIDADERCTEALAGEIAQKVRTAPDTAYWTKRINHFAGKRVSHGPLSPDWVLRLLPQKGSHVEGRVHPKICVSVPESRLKEEMLHFTYRDWAHYESKMNFYSRLAAEKYFGEGRKSSLGFDVFVRPMVAFIKMYFFKRGFLDGSLGWMLCKQYANYTMAKYIKLDELNRKNR